MTETGFGGGGYAFTLADIPSAPILEEHTATSIQLAVGSDNNPPHTRYAIENVTDSAYVAADGSASASAVWQTRMDWGTIMVTGLAPSTLYTFRITACNTAGVESGPGPAAVIFTINLGTDDLDLTISVKKASSTISAPLFMRGLGPGIRVAGKDLHELGFVADRITGLDVPQVIADEELVPGGHGWYVWDEYFAPKRINIEGHLHGSSPSDLLLRLAYLKSFLTTFIGVPWRSTAPVRIELNDIPERYWNAYYERLDSIEPLGRINNAASVRLAIRMKCPEPFAFADEVTRAVFVPTAETFVTLDLGNAPSEAVYAITGPAENPSFTIGDMVLHCDFSEGLIFQNEENNEISGVYTPAGNEAAAYRITTTGTGILASGTDTIAFNSIGSSTDASWVAVIAPCWQSSLREENAVILEHRLDSNNYIRLYWNAVTDTWVFRKRSNGIDREVSSPPQAFTAESRIILGITFDSTNAGGMKLFVNGLQAGIGTDTTPLAGAPHTLTLHTGDDTLQPDTVFDMIAGWSRMLSADEMLKIATDPGAVRNHNVTVSYAGTLNEGDTLTLDSLHKTAKCFDISTGTRTNVLHDVTGDIPLLTPGRKRTASDRTQTVIYAKTAAAGFEVRYTRRYL